MRKRLLACGHYVSGRETSRVGQNQWWCFEHRRWEYAADAPPEDCKRCRIEVPYGTLDTDMLCNDCAGLKANAS